MIAVQCLQNTFGQYNGWNMCETAESSSLYGVCIPSSAIVVVLVVVVDGVCSRATSLLNLSFSPFNRSTKEKLLVKEVAYHSEYLCVE